MIFLVMWILREKVEKMLIFWIGGESAGFTKAEDFFPPGFNSTWIVVGFQFLNLIVLFPRNSESENVVIARNEETKQSPVWIINEIASLRSQWQLSISSFSDRMFCGNDKLALPNWSNNSYCDTSHTCCRWELVLL